MRDLQIVAIYDDWQDRKRGLSIKQNWRHSVRVACHIKKTKKGREKKAEKS